MREVVFEPTFDGWREAARALLAEGAAPHEIAWTERGAEQPLLDGLTAEPPAVGGAAVARVPRAFLAGAPQVACFRDVGRWTLLYRVLWRLTHGEPRLMEIVVDPDVHRMAAMEKAVRRDAHKMHAFVRFRRVDGPDAGAAETYVAWFRPEHLIVEHATPFFARRFAAMRAEMPKKYWDNLPEAALIPELVQEAPARVVEMIERAKRELSRPAGRTPRRGG